MLCQSQGSIAIPTSRRCTTFLTTFQLHYELGLAYHLTNSRQQALEYLKKALQLGVEPETRLRIEGWIE